VLKLPAVEYYPQYNSSKCRNIIFTAGISAHLQRFIRKNIVITLLSNGKYLHKEYGMQPLHNGCKSRTGKA
jgi:hypothetical protein